MEEKMLEIIRNRINGFLSCTVQQQEVHAAKEIASHFKSFIEWKDVNTMYDRISKTEVRYVLSDINAPAIWVTLDELYNFWVKEVKK